MTCERRGRRDMICTPVIASTALISNRELGELFPYSFQVTRIIFIFADIKLVATTKEYILCFRPRAISVLELRGLNLNAGPILNYDPHISARGHWFAFQTGWAAASSLASSGNNSMLAQIALPEHERTASRRRRRFDRVRRVCRPSRPANRLTRTVGPNLDLSRAQQTGGDHVGGLWS